MVFFYNFLDVQEFRCPFDGNCKVDAVTRRFCQRCRLRKCFDVGMRKEWIMSDEEKVKKKQKIEANRVRRLQDSGLWPHHHQQPPSSPPGNSNSSGGYHDATSQPTPSKVARQDGSQDLFGIGIDEHDHGASRGTMNAKMKTFLSKSHGGFGFYRSKLILSITVYLKAHEVCLPNDYSIAFCIFFSQIHPELGSTAEI